MATDLVIEVDNEPGALAKVATAVSDGGVNISAATCTSPGARAQLHILVKHGEAAKHALATDGRGPERFLATVRRWTPWGGRSVSTAIASLRTHQRTPS